MEINFVFLFEQRFSLVIVSLALIDLSIGVMIPINTFNRSRYGEEGRGIEMFKVTSPGGHLVQ